MTANDDTMIDVALRLIHIDGVTFNFVVGDAECCPLLCGDKHDVASPVVRVPLGSTMIDLLVLSGFFPSKGQARKNWTGHAEIPPGYSEVKVGKGPRQQIFFIVSPFDSTNHVGIICDAGGALNNVCVVP